MTTTCLPLCTPVCPAGLQGCVHHTPTHDLSKLRGLQETPASHSPPSPAETLLSSDTPTSRPAPAPLCPRASARPPARGSEGALGVLNAALSETSRRWATRPHGQREMQLRLKFRKDPGCVQTLRQEAQPAPIQLGFVGVYKKIQANTSLLEAIAFSSRAGRKAFLRIRHLSAQGWPGPS